jgi:3-hydroxyacyl-[acyl-carrier-protein] dehydratase
MNQEKRGLTIEEIKERIPHRYPMLLVDAVTEIDMEEVKIIGVKNVTFNEYFFQGHFPEIAIMPGVLIVEALAQIGGILMFEKGYQGLKVLASIRNAKFRRPVRPGDVLTLEARALHLSSRGGKIQGEARVGKEIAVEGEIVFGSLPMRK